MLPCPVTARALHNRTEYNDLEEPPSLSQALRHPDRPQAHAGLLGLSPISANHLLWWFPWWLWSWHCFGYRARDLVWAGLLCCPWASGATRHKVRPASGKHQRVGKGTCLLCQGADSRSSVLREETDSVCILYISHVHPWAPGQAPFCPVRLLAPCFLGDTPHSAMGKQVPAAALKQPRAHHHLSFMTPEGQCRQRKRPAGGRGTDITDRA